MKKLHILLSLIACTISVGCGKQSTEKESVTASETSPNETDVALNVADTVTVGTLPKNFPPDVVVYPEAKSLSSFTTPGSTLIGFETADSIKAVTEHYQTEMADNGWTEKTILNMNDIAMIAFSKKNRVVTVIITPSETKTQISLTLTTEAK